MLGGKSRLFFSANSQQKQLRCKILSQVKWTLVRILTLIFRNDVLTMDICDIYFASSGADNKLSIWNTFTGSLKQTINLPFSNRGGGIYAIGLKFLVRH
jgi:WD40 repeat protein